MPKSAKQSSHHYQVLASKTKMIVEVYLNLKGSPQTVPHPSHLFQRKMMKIVEIWQKNDRKRWNSRHNIEITDPHQFSVEKWQKMTENQSLKNPRNRFFLRKISGKMTPGNILKFAWNVFLSINYISLQLCILRHLIFIHFIHFSEFLSFNLEEFLQLYKAGKIDLILDITRRPFHQFSNLIRFSSNISSSSYFLGKIRSFLAIYSFMQRFYIFSHFLVIWIFNSNPCFLQPMFSPTINGSIHCFIGSTC